MKKLEECKEMYKDAYMTCLDCSAFRRSSFAIAELTAFNTTRENLRSIYGAEFDEIQPYWCQEAVDEYYKA